MCWYNSTPPLVAATPHTAPQIDLNENIALTVVQKSIALSPARHSTRERVARMSSAVSVRSSRSASRQTQSRRRDVAKRLYTCASHDVPRLGLRRRCSPERMSVQCAALNDQIRLSCANVHESCQVSRRPGCLFGRLPSFNLCFLFSPPLQALGCAGTSRPRGLCLGFLHVDGSFLFLQLKAVM